MDGPKGHWQNDHVREARSGEGEAEVEEAGGAGVDGDGFDAEAFAGGVEDLLIEREGLVGSWTTTGPHFFMVLLRTTEVPAALMPSARKKNGSR